MSETAAAVSAEARAAAAPAAAPPTPERIFAAENAFQRTAALKGAVELDLFTAIAEGNDAVKALARRCAASERGIRILCDFLVVEGFLEKTGDRYALAPDAAAFLDRRSPAYLGTTIRFLNSEIAMGAFRDVAALVRKGSTLVGDEGAMVPENPAWVEFARSMAPLMALPADLIAQQFLPERVGKVLDIAAGHGLFGIAIAKRRPEARVVALDWANVLEVARENARAAGVGERYEPKPGDAFTADLGSGYDVVLLTNFLHHFDPETNVKLLAKVHASLAPGGRAVALDFVPDESRVTPPRAAAFSMIMLAMTKAGDAYTFPELEGMFLEAGFADAALHPLPPTMQQVVVAKR